jgi:hypothetical protein
LKSKTTPLQKGGGVLIAAAVCPHPPLLVPEVAGAAAPELDDLRAACDEAVRRILAAGPDRLVVVGGDEETREYGTQVTGSLAPYGLDLTTGPGEPALPLSLTIAQWLLTRAAPHHPRRDLALRAGAKRKITAGVGFRGVAFEASPAACLALGRGLAAAGDRVALLAMGDGSACRNEKAPGYFDERAAPYDAAVARALGRADAAALAGLDPGLSRELQVAGRAAWQVLAGAAAGGGHSGGFSGSLLADVAPYGVGYFVACWLREVR